MRSIRSYSGQHIVCQDCAYLSGEMYRDSTRASRIERTVPITFGVETADVGIDLYTPVTTDYRECYFSSSSLLNRAFQLTQTRLS
jgi:hypothetical protein